MEAVKIIHELTENEKQKAWFLVSHKIIDLASLIFVAYPCATGTSELIRSSLCKLLSTQYNRSESPYCCFFGGLPRQA